MIKLKEILKEVIGFQFPGTEKPKFIGRSTQEEFAKFFNNFEGTTKTAISNYGDQIRSSDIDNKTKKETSEILTDLEELSIDIQTELGERQIGDDEVSQTLFDYINSEVDFEEATPFEDLVWYDKQIDMSLKSGMTENAIAILGQLRDQLEFIRGFILQEFPEKAPIGY